MRLPLLALVSTVVCAPAGAAALDHAGVPRPAGANEDLGRALGADPDRPRISLAYRGALRGALGLRLPLWRSDGDGLSFDLTPLIELHEPPGSDQPLPNQFWRGLLSAGGDYRHGWPGAQLRAGLRIGHESDHETAHPFSAPGFLALNFVEAPAALALELGPWQLDVGAALRAYALSCTRRTAPCRDLEGDGGLGGSLGVGIHRAVPLWLELRPFAAAAVSGIVGTGVLQSERRVSARLGVFVPIEHGLLQFFALAFFGHDVGITRRDELSQLGLGVAWTLTL